MKKLRIILKTLQAIKKFLSIWLKKNLSFIQTGYSLLISTFWEWKILQIVFDAKTKPYFSKVFVWNFKILIVTYTAFDGIGSSWNLFLGESTQLTT